MGMEPTGLTRSLKKMYDMGLIRKEIDKKDKRKVHIFLTDEGKSLRKVTRRVVLQFNNSVQALIEPEKFEIFFEILSNLNDLLDEEHFFQKKN